MRTDSAPIVLLIETSVTSVQPFWSVTVTLWTPSLSLVAFCVLSPLSQLKEKGEEPPEIDTEATPSLFPSEPSGCSSIVLMEKPGVGMEIVATSFLPEISETVTS